MERREALDFLAEIPASTGIFCDFDGTLSAIADTPDAARPVDGAADVLETLARSFAAVGVLSGRALDDLRSRFGPRGVLLAGAYGRERSDGVATPIDRAMWSSVVDAAEHAVADRAGVIVEPKGAGVAIHYRLAPDRADEIADLSTELARRFGLVVLSGRRVVELVEPGPGKADALRELVAGVERFVFAGDDVADADAFAWARASGERCVLLGVRSPEAPDAIVELADLVVDGAAQAVAFFRDLAEEVRRPD